MTRATMEQATAIKSRFESIVIRKPGVSGVDLDASDGGDPVIRVYVQSRARAPELPSAVEGIRVEVVERSFDAP